MSSLLTKHRKEVVAVAILLALFLAAGYFSRMYLGTLTELISGNTAAAMLIYVVGATIATVIAPLSFFPVLPVAVAVWGSFVAAVLSLIAWSLGAAIAYLLARRFGRPLVRHFVGEEKMNNFSRFMPQKHLFTAVVFLRMVLPVDLLSYALGLMGVMRFWPYMLATVIGIMPFAFLFAYIADVSAKYQIIALLLGICLIVISFPYVKRQYRQKFQDEYIQD